MDLVVKDMSLFSAVAQRANVPLEVAPVLLDIFKDGEARFGSREWSPNIIKRLEETCGIEILAAGFPVEMTDDEPEVEGYEVVVGAGA
jgi:3-hydroxyisobutyrate dehydrogenase